MKKTIFLIFLLLSIGITCFAASTTQVNFINERVFPNDYFAIGQNISNISVVQGDMLTIGDTISNTGKVNGDFLGIATNVYLNGMLLDDVRVIGQNIKLDASVSKNVNMLFKIAQLSTDTFIKGDLLAAGSDLTIDGTVNGATYIACSKVVLNGKFNGDVVIKIIGDANSATPITIGPNAVIKGSLRYTSPREALTSPGAKIGNIEKTIAAAKTKNTADVNGYSFVRSFVSALVYSLIALLIIRLFPNFINKSTDIFKTKTLSSFGSGLLGAISMIFSAIVTVALFVGIIFISPVFAFAYMTISTAVYVALFYLATIPAALIIGDMVIKNDGKQFIKLTLGVVLISFINIFLEYLSQATAFGAVFDLINVILVVFISLTGFGSLIKALKLIYRQKETQAA